MNIPQKSRYINPFTDYGFNRLLGEALSKDLLIDFLNALLSEEQGAIKELRYMNIEKSGDTVYGRHAIFDLYCINEYGERFIVELQKNKQNFFKDRSVYHATFPIQEQAKKGDDWKFKLDPVYNICILDFIFDEDKNDESYRYNIKLSDLDAHKVFYDKLTFIYLSMPKFNKALDELSTQFEKWLYAFRHLSRLQEQPESLQGGVFDKFFQLAEIARLSPEEHQVYKDSLKNYWDLNNTLETAREEGMDIGFDMGIEEGRQEGIAIGMERGHEEGMEKGMEKGTEAAQLNIARDMKADGVPLETIAKYTNLPISVIETLY